ncbi:Charged multivesicular body protein 6 [Ceratobasidium theobromae]|uniref:Charged multivesicular body protein 6 n=1 Tax=Ceratobasidium theobromae TaxID=1582974 RepID=A0A5N5QFZ9_9AGAM|nr:Charged multivesicular body protein 6 [Ceratobasidium theobromae]
MGGNQSVPKISAQDRAIVDLKNQRDELKRFRRRIQGVLDREHAIAKEALANGNKRIALLALRRRKYQESMLQKTDGQLETLENLVSSIEFALVEKDIIFGLQQGNKVLKALHAEMSLEDVEKLMEETAEAVAYQKEIDEMLSSQMTVDEEEAVQKELEQLQSEALGNVPIHEPSPAKPVSLPLVPVEEPKEPGREENVREPQQRVALPA